MSKKSVKSSGSKAKKVSDVEFNNVVGGLGVIVHDGKVTGIGINYSPTESRNSVAYTQNKPAKSDGK